MRKVWRERIDKLERKVEYLGNVDTNNFGKFIREDCYTECDGCGCLIKKEDKNKLPSTVEIIVDTTSQYRGSYPYTYISPTEIITEREVLKEHYSCRRCNPTKKKAQG